MDYVDAFADVDNEVSLVLEPEPMTFTGKLLLSDHVALTSGYGQILNAYPVAGRQVQIRASEYYRDHMPEETHLIEVSTDASGRFTVSLIPGLYGVVAPDLNDYWGYTLEVFDLDSETTLGTYRWPYYRQWPHSLESAKAYLIANDDWMQGGLGGIAFSSGENLVGTFTLPKKEFRLNLYVQCLHTTSTHRMVIGLVNSQVKTRNYFNDLLSSTVTLSGPVDESVPVERNVSSSGVTSAMARITGHVPGTYSLSVGHPRYALETLYRYGYGSDKSYASFEWFDFPNPGVLPETAFPEDYTGFHPLPSAVRLYGDMSFTDTGGEIAVTFYKWSSYWEEYYDAGSSDKFMRFDYAGDRTFFYDGSDRMTSNGPYDTYTYYNDDGGTYWYKLSCQGGGFSQNVYIGGDLSTPTVAPLEITFDVNVEARDITVDPGDDNGLIEDVKIDFSDGTSVVTPAALTGMADARFLYANSSQVSHSNWVYSAYSCVLDTVSGSNPVFRLTVLMRRGLAVQGEILNNETGEKIPGARVDFFHEDGTIYGTWPYHRVSDDDGHFTLAYGSLYNRLNFMEVRADGFEPYRKRLDPSDAVDNPEDPRTRMFIMEGEAAIKLAPLKKPVIAEDTLTMNRRGAFLPGAKKAGNQSAFNAFNADGPLTMTWSLDVGLEQKDYTVTLPGFDGQDETLALEDGIKEVWLVDMKSFPDSSYNDSPVTLALPETFEPAQAAAFLKNIRTGAEGYENVYYRLVTGFTTDESDPDVVGATGQVKLWQLPPDLFRPAFIVVTNLGAVNAYVPDYTGAWEGRELTGARLPPWFAGMADIMGSVAGSQAMLGEGLKNAIPKGKIIALPTFTANVVLRASRALDYVYSIDTRVKEGMQNKIGGIMGLAPGFLGLSLYGGIEATLKGEDREFYVQMKGGISKQDVNAGDYSPGFLKKLGAKVELTPPPSGEVYSYDSYKFDPDNRPDEVAVLYGVSGQVGAEISASIFPVLKYIPKAGPVLYLLYKSGAVDIRGLTKGIIGVRSLSGFKTTFPRQEEHYAVQGAETRQLRRHFLGGNEVGDPVNADDPEKTESLDIAFGFGVGVNVRAAHNSVGATGTIEMAGDDAWTGAPAMLLDVNPNGDWPIITRARGDLRAVLTAYLSTWVARFQKKWFWKAWPIDYQFGTESAMYLIEMEVVTQRRDLGDSAPAEFDGRYPVLVDQFLPMGTFSSAAGEGDVLLYTDVGTHGGMVLKAGTGNDGEAWEDAVAVADAEGVVTDVGIMGFTSGGGGRLAVWTEIEEEDADDLDPPSRIMYSVGTSDGTQWSDAAEAAGLESVAAGLTLISRGETVAVLFTEVRDGPQGGSEGIKAMVWDRESWSAPVTLTSSIVTGFGALGSGDLTRRPSLIGYVNDENELYVLEWASGVSEPSLLMEEAGGACALGGDEDLAYLACSGREGGIRLFRYAGGTEQWSDLGVVFPDAVPRELSVAVASEAGRPMVVVLWTQSDGAATDLYCGTLDLTDRTGTAVARLTDLDGDFRSPVLYASGSDGVLTAMGLHEDGAGNTQLRGYRVSGLMAYGDMNGDGVADLTDLIMILQVLAGEGPLEISGKSLSDLYGNGRIDMADGVILLRMLIVR